MKKKIMCTKAILVFFSLVILPIFGSVIVTAAPISINSIVQVQNVGPGGLNVRGTAGGVEIGERFDGDRGIVIGGPEYAYYGGILYKWWKIDWQYHEQYTDLIGWSIESYGSEFYLVDVPNVPPLQQDLISPGTLSPPGPYIETLPPTFQWTGIYGAESYALAISESPYGTENIIYNPQHLYGTSHTIPNGWLQPNKLYRWNMQAWHGSELSDISELLYFRTSPLYTVTFQTDPSNGGTITFNGNTYSNGQSININTGTYSISANPSTGPFIQWTTTGGITVSNPSLPSTTATITNTGNLKAFFDTTSNPQITFQTNPSNGGTITFNSNTYSNGQTAQVPTGGPYTINANPTSGFNFLEWTTTGGVSVPYPTSQGTYATVNNQGTLKASFNRSPNVPNIPSGPASLTVGQSGTFSTSATDPDGDQVQYLFDWNSNGFHEYSDYTGLVPSGQSGSMLHIWNSAGTYVVKARACDEHGIPSDWSNGFTVTVGGGNQLPNPPTLIAPGSSDSPGEKMYTISYSSYTFEWYNIAEADEYGLYVWEADSNELIFDSQSWGLPITGTTYTLPFQIFEWGKQYLWCMNSKNEFGWGELSSPLYFYTAQLDLLSNIIQQEMQEKKTVWVDGIAYYVVTLKKYIDPEDWQPSEQTFLAEAPDVRKVITDFNFVPISDKQLEIKIWEVDRANNLLKHAGSSDRISGQIESIDTVFEADNELANAEYEAMWAKTAIFATLDFCVNVELEQPVNIAGVIKDIIFAKLNYDLDPNQAVLTAGRALLEAAKTNYSQAKQLADENPNGFFYYDDAKMYLDSFYNGYYKNSYGVDIVLPRDRITESALYTVSMWIPDYINHLGSKLLSDVPKWGKIGVDVKNLYVLSIKGVISIYDVQQIVLNAEKINDNIQQLGEDEYFSIDFTLALLYQDESYLSRWGIHGIDNINTNIACPAELRVYDSKGNITGTINGEIKWEIPSSFYYNKSVTIFLPNDTYTIEVMGTDTGEGFYNLTIKNTTAGETTTFNATDIPTSANAIHQYTLNWSSLSQGQNGTTVRIDSDGDGNFEHNYTTNATVNIPSAYFTYTQIDKNLTFNAYNSFIDPYIDAIFTWNFDDGTTSNDIIVNHTYSEYGTYTVTLTVIDDAGKNDTISKTISVVENPPPASPGYEIDQGWLSDENLYYTYTARRTARAPNGELYVAYSVNVDGYEQIYLKKSTDNGETWGNGEMVHPENTDQATPCLLIDSQNRIIVIWKNSDDQLFYKRKVGANWEQIQTIADQVMSGFVAAALGPSDDVHVLYSSDSAGCRYRMRTSTGWHDEEIIAAGSYQRARDIVVENNGDVHAFYHDASGQYLVLMYNGKIGGEWGSATIVGQTDNEGGGPSAAIDDTGVLHIVWSYKTNGIYYICHRQYDSGWEPTIQYIEGPTSFIQQEPSISTDSKNNLHVMWYGMTAESPSYFQIRYCKYSSGWGSIVELTDADVDQRNIVTVWGNYPQIEGAKINRPGIGFAFVWNDGSTIRFYKSPDLAWIGGEEQGYEVGVGTLGVIPGAETLARTSDGILHCVYHRSDGQYTQIYHSYSTDNGETWSEEPLTDESYDQLFPAIAVDSNNYIHVVWQGCYSGSPAHPQIRYIVYTTQWSAITTITTDINWDQRTPAIAIDTNDNPHVVWQKIEYFGEPWSMGGIGPTFYSKRTAGSWSTPVLIGEAHEYNEVNASIVIDKFNYLHVAWTAGGYRNFDCWHSAYRRFTTYWEPVESFECYARYPSLAADSTGTVHLVYCLGPYDNQIVYRKRTESTSWSSPEVIAPNSSPVFLKKPSISVDSNQHLYVFWNDNDGSIRCRKYTSSWQDIETLISDIDSASPYLISTWYPEVNGIRTNIPKNGYAFIWNDGPIIKFYKSQDLTWDDSDENIIYVPDDYSTIQAAVDAALSDDTIIVRDGTYIENVNVNTDHLTIKSENGSTSTIVQAANSNDNTFEVQANFVTINGFTIQGASASITEAGIYLYYGEGCRFTRNICRENHIGIALWTSSNNRLDNNSCSWNTHFGIALGYSSSYNIIENNTCNWNQLYDTGATGILLGSWSEYNTIKNNTCSNNDGTGIAFSQSSYNTVVKNTCSENPVGICRYADSISNTIYLNNFISNTENVYSDTSASTWNSLSPITYTYSGNTFNNYMGNYWSDYLGSDENSDRIGDQPYNVGGGNYDNYPLMDSFENYFDSGNQPKGNILVYSTTSDGTPYDKTYFDTDLPMILENYGYFTTVTDRKSTPQITSSLLEQYDELWVFSSYPASMTQFSQSEIDVILNFRNQGHGLLIMADHTDGLYDYSDDANQISVPLGVTYYGYSYQGDNGESIEPDFIQHPLFTGVDSIACHESEAQMIVNNPAQVLATNNGDNVIAIVDDGLGRVVFDASFPRMFNSGFAGFNWILIGDTPHYTRNIADWLMGAGSQPPSGGLIGYWSFDEGTGNIAQDTSGNGNDGTIYGATWTTGVSGGALSFDGINDYVEISDVSDFVFNDESATFSAWAQIVDNPDLYRTFIFLGDSNDYSREPYFFMGKSRSGYVDGRLFANIVRNDQSGYLAVSDQDGASLPKNTWIHLCGVVDYPNHVLKLYINGNLEDSVYLGSYDLGSASQLKLRFGMTSFTTYDLQHKGLLDEIRIYNKALSETEIQDLYNQDGGNQPPVDEEPPQIIQDFVADDYEDGKCTLHWTNPSDEDLSLIIVVKNAYNFPVNHLDGEIIATINDAEPGNTETFIDNEAVNKNLYFYAVFSSDVLSHWNEKVFRGYNADMGRPGLVTCDFKVATTLKEGDSYCFDNYGILDMSTATQLSIADEIFDWTGVEEPIKKEVIAAWFTAQLGGNCFGFTSSALMEKAYPYYDYFLEDYPETSISHLPDPPFKWIPMGWDGSDPINPILRHISKFMNQQYSVTLQAYIDDVYSHPENFEPKTVIQRLQQLMDKDVCLLVLGNDKKFSHVVVPYRIEAEGTGYKVFVYDPNHQGYDDDWPFQIYYFVAENLWQENLAGSPSASGNMLCLIPIRDVYHNKLLHRPDIARDGATKDCYVHGNNLSLYFNDSQGRITGIMDNTIYDQIPNATIRTIIADDSATNNITSQGLRFKDNNSFTANVQGYGSGLYSLWQFGLGYFVNISSIQVYKGSIDTYYLSSDSISITSSENQSVKNYNLTIFNASVYNYFRALNIPLNPEAIHNYSFNWPAIYQGQEGVTMQIDNDGDGIFEKTITSDSELTYGEYILKIDDTPPITSKTIGSPKCGLNDEWITYSTIFNLTATDDLSGVDATYYRIWYNGAWTLWNEYTGNFTLLGGGKHYLEYYSVDNAGNVEETYNETHYVDDLPPSTIKAAGTPKFGDTDQWITAATLFNLTSSDNIGGSGLNTIKYRIWYSGGWTSWVNYISNFTLSEEGQHYLEYYSVDNLGNVEEIQNQTHYVDDISPITTKTVGTPKSGSNDLWITSSTPFNLSANDTIDESGINMIKYRIWYNGGWMPWIDYNSNFTLSGQDIHYLEYYSIDNLGNAEITNNQTHYIDDAPPNTICSTSGTAGQNSWYTTNVSITLNAIDPQSGINSTLYRINGCPWQNYTNPFNITSNGIHLLEFYSIDMLNNQECIRTMTIKIDKTLPTLNITKPEIGFLYICDKKIYYVGQTIAIKGITVKVNSSDTMSGIAKVEFYVDNILKSTDSIAPYSWKWNEKIYCKHKLKTVTYDQAGNTKTTDMDVWVFNW